MNCILPFGFIIYLVYMYYKSSANRVSHHSLKLGLYGSLHWPYIAHPSPNAHPIATKEISGSTALFLFPVKCSLWKSEHLFSWNQFSFCSVSWQEHIMQVFEVLWNDSMLLNIWFTVGVSVLSGFLCCSQNHSRQASSFSSFLPFIVQVFYSLTHWWVSGLFSRKFIILFPMMYPAFRH